MSLILSIETATAICSIALHDAGQLIADMAMTTDRSQATALPVMIEVLLKTSKQERKQLAAIAVSQGPGSYTGLRIGSSVGKGLSYGLDIPLIAIPTLEAMAHAMRPFIDDHRLLCPTIDARRTAIYTLIMNTDGQIIWPTQVALLDSAAYTSQLPEQPMLFFGDGVEKCKKFLTAPHISFQEGILPSAIHIGSLAFYKFQLKLWEDRASYTPLYLHQFQMPYTTPNPL